MNNKKYNSETDISYNKPKVYIYAVRILSLLILLQCTGCPTDTSIVDVNDCNRIEIRYPRGTLPYFVPTYRDILNQAETKYIQSHETFVLTDEERIKAFTSDMNSGSYTGRLRGALAYGFPVQVTCYKNSKRIVSFTVYGNTVVFDDKRMFKYQRGIPNLEIIEPLEMRPFKLRFLCSLNIDRLYASGYSRKDSYPDPNQWCDIIMQTRDNASYVTEEKMRKNFICLGANSGKCHYAMNPNCKPDSPGDMVLLFETKAGWNQHGGPELLTFDNHDPKGGCVLFNDGTLKFIP